MRLRVAGIEAIEITDPDNLCGTGKILGGPRKGLGGTRKKLDQSLLQQLTGQDFTAEQLKSMFGYSKVTSLQDTQLKHLIEPVKKNMRDPYAEKSTRWRIK